MSTSELQLIRDYATEGSQAAFTELVSRHVDLVYSAAKRQVRSPDLAEEVTQTVFITLSRHIHDLKPEAPLTAWLYLVTRRAAIDVVRRESRRQAREHTAAEIATMTTNTPAWPRVEPLLDEAMEALNESDRTAILLRYFENKSLREVGRTLGTSDDAAQKRVTRALEQLRTFFSKRGVTVGAAALAADLTAGAVQTAPIGLGLTIASATAISGVAGQIAAIETVKVITMTTIQKTFVGTTLAALIGAGFYGQRVMSRQESEIRTLRAQVAQSIAENQQLRRDREDDVRLLQKAQVAIDSAREKTSGATGAASGGDPLMEAELKSVLARVIVLKDRMKENRDWQIPELRFLKDQDWINAAAKHKLGTAEDFRAAARSLRTSAKLNFTDPISKALSHYARANEGQIPLDISLLTPYFDPPVPAEALQRYGIVRAGKLSEVSSETVVVAEMPVADPNRDPALFMLGQGNVLVHSGSLDDVSSPVLRALSDFVKANAGVQLTDPSQLVPYLSTPVEPAKLQGFWKALGLPKNLHHPKD